MPCVEDQDVSINESSTNIICSTLNNLPVFDLKFELDQMLNLMFEIDSIKFKIFPKFKVSPDCVRTQLLIGKICKLS